MPTNQRANSEFANLLKERMEKVKPQPVTRHDERKILVFRELESSPYVIRDPYMTRLETLYRRLTTGHLE